MANALLHVPSICRSTHDCRGRAVLAVARGSDKHSQLEEGSSKLLVSPVLPGLGAAAEAPRRFTLWEERRGLPQTSRSAADQVRKRSDASAQADRARRTTAAAGHRKATTGLASSMLSFEESEAGCTPIPPEADWDRPFDGLHYAALTAPGFCGTRAEHIIDLLNVPRRVHANKIHAALLLAPIGCSLAHAHAALLAMASRGPSRWESSCARPTPSGL